MRDYIKFGAPNAKQVRSLYTDALKELAFPFPSTHVSRMPQFSKIIGGFRAKEFSIFCGATGSGKTTFCANLSRSFIEDKIPHFVASVETGHTDFIKRVISAMADEDWNTGDPVPQSELERFNKIHLDKFRDAGQFLSLYDNRFKVEVLMSDIAWMVKEHGIKIAIIDNLNFFLEVTRSSDQIVEMDRVIHELIIFCKQVDVHVIMIMHPRKTDGGRVESEFDVKGSSTAVQEAHNIFLFNRLADPATEEEKLMRELKIAKMRRRGKAVGCKVEFITKNGVSYQEKGVENEFGAKQNNYKTRAKSVEQIQGGLF